MNRGKQCEQLVTKDLTSRGYKLYKANLKTPFAEIDILLSHAAKPWLMVEVKSSNSTHFDTFRLSQSQKARQQRAYMYLQSQLDVDLQMIVAIVSARNKITYYSYDQL